MEYATNFMMFSQSELCCRCFSSLMSCFNMPPCHISPDFHSSIERGGLGNLQYTHCFLLNFPLSSMHLSFHNVPVSISSASSIKPSGLPCISIFNLYASAMLSIVACVKTPLVSLRRLLLVTSHTCGDGWSRRTERIFVTTFSLSGDFRNFSTVCLK